MNLLYANDRRGEYPPSWYAASADPLPAFAPAAGKLKADVCIVGGGYTGLSAALHLAGRGYDVVLVEAQRVGFGASGRNGGQVGSGQLLGQDDLEALLGRDMAHRLWLLGEEAKALVQALIRDHKMNLAFHPGILYTCNQASQVAKAHALAEKMRTDYGYDALDPLGRAATRAIVNSDAYHGGVLDHGAGHIHPLRYAFGLARAAEAAGARIFEASEVVRIDPGPKALVQTGHCEVAADYVILACNGYLGGLNSQIAARVMPLNNFILATEPLGMRASGVLTRGVAVADSKFVVNYFRLSEDGRLLFGGGETYGYRFPQDIAATVRAPMLRIFPHLADVQIDYAWGGTLAITRSRMPCFARLAPNILNASGYSGYGVAMATMAGKVLAEAVAGQAERFDLLASVPGPDFPGGAALRWPLLVLAMTWFSLRDRIGF